MFVNEEPKQVAGLLNSGVIDIAQLHGEEDNAYIKILRKMSDRPIIQAFRIKMEKMLRGTEEVKRICSYWIPEPGQESV